MTSTNKINEIIKREVNPFDLINLKPGNFWGEKQDSTQMVESIHQEAVVQIEELLDSVARDNHSRGVLLVGDSGSGKSYLLGRVKRKLNPKAFFAYIGPWADSNHIWRHILRCSVDSLLEIPQGHKESQLMLWLRNLSAFTQSKSIWQLLRSDRRKFIKYLKETYKQAGLYNPDIFFGVLHDLTVTELYPLACEWLRGDDLSDESMEALRVKRCITSEDAAKNVLANFGRISTATQPIVLCFDNLDNIPRLADGYGDLQALFNANTTIHNNYLKNFLVIISIVTDTWRHSWYRVRRADKARVDKEIKLKLISLEQAEALWSHRLNFLHRAPKSQIDSQTDSQSNSVIFPLNRKLLEDNFPGGKTQPRNCLTLGRQEYQKYKLSLLEVKHEQDTRKEEFELIWQKELKKNQAKISKIDFLTAPDLVRMLREALEAFQVQDIEPKLISGKYASYSLSYQEPKKQEKIGIVWTEEANMASFFRVMSASQKAVLRELCHKLYLIRSCHVGNSRLKGYKIYQEIFQDTQNVHLNPDLSSVHQLATYHSLVNSAYAQELVIAGKTINLRELQSLIRESKILEKCTLLQRLEIVTKAEINRATEPARKDLQPVKDFLFRIVKIQGYMGLMTLIEQCRRQLSHVMKSEIESSIYQLCEEEKVKIINPDAKLQEQLICLIT